MSAAIRISHMVVSTMPPPTTQPATAPITGLSTAHADAGDGAVEIVGRRLEVGAGRERLVAGPGQDRHAVLLARHEAPPGLVQALDDRGIDAVHALGPVDGDDGDAVLGPVGDGVAAVAAHGGVLARAGMGRPAYWPRRRLDHWGPLRTAANAGTMARAQQRAGGSSDGERARRGVRLRAGARCADPLHAAHPRLLRGARLRRALRVGALRGRAVPAAWQSRWRDAGSPSSRRRRPISPTRATRVRARPTMRRPSSTPSTPATRAQDHDLRISHVAHRPQAHDRRGPRHLVPAARAARAPPSAAASARSRRASTACRPTAAIA